MGFIDIHTHAFPDELAARAINSLEAAAPWQAVAGGTISELLDSMDSSGIDVSAICTIATKPGQVKGIFAWCKQNRSRRIVPLPSVHPKDQDAPDWINQFAEAGFVGIKLHPMFQEFTIDDPAMDEIYSTALEENLFITFHCGQDIAFEPDDDRASPARLRKILDRFPGLKVIATHMGGWRMWDQVEQHLLGRDVYLETSFSLAELGPQRAASMIQQHGSHRILFGTDWPWASQKKDIEAIQELPIDESAKNSILQANAADLLGRQSEM